MTTFPRSLRGLFATLFVEIFGASLTIPVFAYFCIAELHLTATYVGMVMSLFSAAQLLGAPIVGRLSDAYGRRGAMLGCFLWTSVCFLATATVRTFSGLLIVRTLAGLSGGSIPVTQAIVMDVAGEEQRPALLGAMGGLLGVAFTLGPGVITAVLFIWNLERRWVFVVAAFCALVGCIVGYFVLEETLPESRRRPLYRRPPEERHGDDADGDASDSKSVLEDVWDCCTPHLLCIWVGRFCSSFAYLCLFSTYAFLIRDSFGWGDREMGMVLAAGGLLGAGVQLFAFPYLCKVIGKHAVFVVGSVLLTIYFLALPVVTLEHRIPCMHLALKALFICGTSFVDPSVPDLVAHYAPEGRMGMVQGITSAFRSLAAVVAPLVAGRAYDVSPFVVYGIAAVAVSVGGVCVAVAPMLDPFVGSGHISRRLAFLSDKFGGTLEEGETKVLVLIK